MGLTSQVASNNIKVFENYQEFDNKDKYVLAVRKTYYDANDIINNRLYVIERSSYWIIRVFQDISNFFNGVRTNENDIKNLYDASKKLNNHIARRIFDSAVDCVSIHKYQCCAIAGLFFGFIMPKTPQFILPISIFVLYMNCKPLPPRNNQLAVNRQAQYLSI